MGSQDVAKNAGESDSLYQGFMDPPASARPFVRWWWNGNCVQAQEICRELDLLKQAGIGGIEINPIGMPLVANPPTTAPLEWLSPEWNAMVKLAADEARRRGMLADLIVGAGWPFGGRFLATDQTIHRVAANVKIVQGPGTFSAPLADLLPEDTRRSGLFQQTLKVLRLVARGATDTGRDVMDAVQPDGTVRLDLPPGRHALHVVTIQTGFRTVAHGAPGADGPVLDHYNRQAVELYLDRMSSRLGPALGGKLGQALRSMFCDSIELTGANWTRDLPDQFRSRRGYDLTPYLPFVLGPEAEDEPAGGPPRDVVRRVRFDLSATLVELFHERFIHTFHQWCHRHGVLSRYQAYGHPWLMGMLEGYMVPDIPEGDTWLFCKYDDFPADKTIDRIRYEVWNKYASSGAHLTGRHVVSCESMTNTTGVFAATLEHVKQADDLNFITGINHSVLHGFNYSPPQAGLPGWVKFGTYFSEHNPWWPHLRRWTDYNARLSWVFQNSQPCSEVAILGPAADVWSRGGLERSPLINTPWYLHLLWQAVHQNGCGADYVGESVLQAATAEGGKCRFGPMAYDLLIVAGVESLHPATAQALQRLAEAGGRIAFVGAVPSRSPGLAEAAANDQQVRQALAKVLKADPSRVARVAEPAYDGLLAWTGDLLRRMGVRPAVEILPPDGLLMQVHHRAGPRDIFLFVNSDRRREIAFRARFAADGATPWRWDPHTGGRRACPAEGADEGLAIILGPLESVLLVLEDQSLPAGKAGPVLPPPAVEAGPLIEIAGPWSLALTPVRGEPFGRTLEGLVDFSQADDEALRAFGGRVVYRAEFDAPGPEYSLLRLGTLNGTSEVVLNGRPLGARWYGRHDYDARGAVRAGRNVLEITATTLLLNHCLAMKGASIHRWTRNQSPVSAGLVGPVRLGKVR